jgi:hypothetical protein
VDKSGHLSISVPGEWVDRSGHTPMGCPLLSTSPVSRQGEVGYTLIVCRPPRETQGGTTACWLFECPCDQCQSFVTDEHYLDDV